MAEPALEDDDAPDQCANPDCRVAQGERCVEGFADKAGCPQFGKIQIVPALEATNASALAKRGVRLQLSTTLDVEAAQLTLRDRECRLIAIVGSVDAGKTSLIAGLYDLFQMGPVGPVAFRQSYSLHAFEEAVHYSRAVSRRDLPDTNRTPRMASRPPRRPWSSLSALRSTGSVDAQNVRVMVTPASPHPVHPTS